ncbi:Fic/DOC family N-terminal domain-containing protein [Sedimentitalea sp. JM2-8]|uniref:Fic/DOC family N-terminal domain-containing protein n=1 Tax=Sedimentitalea xiamensis TaxID=3050037 RepID=A0ABT7FIR1_9RHOB|nr:Fic/DOC family N-terminal domain-containing protein [Sedimentitalea xiamensis]MDK3074968.1 Fic/DOC family N-terminal domain-containing protein [Sedimentitalea xiamensis]
MLLNHMPLDSRHKARSSMRLPLNHYSFDKNVDYHYDQFPPTSLDYERLFVPMGDARAALARYDQTLLGLHNSEFLVSPLRSQEAVVSSRMEGTISTIDEVLRYEADSDDDVGPTDVRPTTLEVALYAAALKRSQRSVEDGYPISEHLIRSAHKTLLGFGRGATKNPGEYKSEQNYVGDDARREVYFTPISPEQLPPSMENLVAFINGNTLPHLLGVAISHVEFEALHPFNDGNGRIGRMLITLSLWNKGLISKPHFYISAFFEERKAEYIERMRQVSASGDWTGWCEFFLEAIAEQAERNLTTAKSITDLYEEMKPVFRETLNSQWSTFAQDFIFKNPVFRNNRFTTRGGIPKPTAVRLSRALVDAGLLIEIEAASGRRAALYAFEPLIRLIRT